MQSFPVSGRRWYRVVGYNASRQEQNIDISLTNDDFCNNQRLYMKLEKYELKSGEQLKVFEFISVGPKGKIPKIVQYSPTNYKNLYNLGFGDKNIETGELDDTIISNNGDSEKVLATVVATLYAFINKHKEAMVYATGSTSSRTRLYRMGLSKYLDEVKEDFEIYGELENGWEEFQKDVAYEAFLVKLKDI